MSCTTSPYVAFSVLRPWLDSVWTASQTRAAMTISGKSALRKKRFKRPLAAGYQPKHAVKRAPRLSRRGDQIRAENADIRQIPVPLAQGEPVARHESVPDLPAGGA